MRRLIVACAIISFFPALAHAQDKRTAQEKISVANVDSAEEGKDTAIARQAEIVEALLQDWGGGKLANGTWVLERHWVGTLKTVLTTGVASEVPLLKAIRKSNPVRFNVLSPLSRADSGGQRPLALLAMSDRYTTLTAVYRESLPSLEDLKDKSKQAAILASFGPQPGWTDSWGTPDRTHWSESWVWFTKHAGKRLRLMKVFAFVSQGKDEPETIDGLYVDEAILRQSDPSNADDLRDFPLPETEVRQRQAAIDANDASHPEPLRSYLRAMHKQYDHELKAYCAFIRDFRNQPNRELLQQLIGNLDEGTCEIRGMATDLFRSPLDERIGQWENEKHAQATRYLIDSLPNANSRESLMRATIIALDEAGIETLEFKSQGIEISLAVQRSPEGSGYSYSSFQVPEAGIRKAGEAVRDELLRMMERK